MDNMLKNSAKYLVGVVVFLIMSALYFFVLSDRAPAFDPAYVMELIDENKALEVQLKEQEFKSAEYLAQITSLQNTISDKETVVEQLQASLDAQDIGEKCAALPPSEEMLKVQQNLIETQTQYIACNANLAKLELESEELKLANETMEASVFALQGFESESLQLQSELNAANEEKAKLEVLLAELQAMQEEFLAVLEPQGPLELASFTMTPDYCTTRYTNEFACVESLNIVATFSFNPNQEMRVSLIDPNNDVVARKQIQARRINRLEFVTEEGLLVGNYQIRFEIDDVINTRERFNITLPP
ncbi:hypothetical protein ACFO4O_05940 [Glaciecola siphonariae]|uniref:Chromosome segregation ATPase n=1 Tax=Glaciecola siphonariae TaxID=521012 RepID=A0ABV9LT51_9ALTE